VQNPHAVAVTGARAVLSTHTVLVLQQHNAGGAVGVAAHGMERTCSSRVGNDTQMVRVEHRVQGDLVNTHHSHHCVAQRPQGQKHNGLRHLKYYTMHMHRKHLQGVPR
jgi:hypothetical protein